MSAEFVCSTPQRWENNFSFDAISTCMHTHSKLIFLFSPLALLCFVSFSSHSSALNNELFFLRLLLLLVCAFMWNSRVGRVEGETIYRQSQWVGKKYTTKKNYQNKSIFEFVCEKVSGWECLERHHDSRQQSLTQRCSDEWIFSRLGH
jgi:hypothetical protein